MVSIYGPACRIIRKGASQVKVIYAKEMTLMDELEDQVT
jgi:hypothetical protein